MILIKSFRDNPDIIIQNLEKRNEKHKVQWVHDIIKWDKQLRQLKMENDGFRADRNKISQEINEKKKKGADVSFLLDDVKELPKKIAKYDMAIEKLEKNIKNYHMRIPNLLHDSVPIGNSDSDNLILKTWGKPRKDKVKTHSDWIVDKGYADMERAAKISGARFYILKDKLYLLQQALLNYAQDVIIKHDFIPYCLPFMVRKWVEEGGTDLDDFKEVIYKIDGEDLYLSPTSEHTLAAMHANETLTQLPKLYMGMTTCFRKEAGSHGKDTKGIFRVHQFNKVEMFVLSLPEKSWEWHDKMLFIEEQIIQGLGLPYRVVNLCSSELAASSAKTYDIEVWMPASQKYRELLSCSNCTTYQSVRNNIRTTGKQYVHTLNATGIADTRTLAVIIENYMQDNGNVKVPEVLKKYVNFTEL